jgi:hypothetical protein
MGFIGIPLSGRSKSAASYLSAIGRYLRAFNNSGGTGVANVLTS